MSSILLLLIYVLILVSAFPQFKVINYGGSWKIFKRFVGEQCSYYEQVDDDYYFLIQIDGKLYFGFNKKWTNQQTWSIPNCPEVEETFSIKYVKSVATGQWYKNIEDDNLAKYVQDYDLETCVKYNNLGFTVYNDMINIENPNNIDCISLVQQTIGQDIGDEYLLILDYETSCGYDSLHSVTLGKS